MVRRKRGREQREEIPVRYVDLIDSGKTCLSLRWKEPGFAAGTLDLLKSAVHEASDEEIARFVRSLAKAVERAGGRSAVYPAGERSAA